MTETESTNSESTDERSALLNDQIHESTPSSHLESIQHSSSGCLNEATKKERFRAIRICYFGMFVSSIVFSMTVSSLWPFLQRVDSSANTSFLGSVVASFSIGQLIASPIIGFIANRYDNNKMPLVISTAIIVVSNILYGYVQSINNVIVSNKFWIMLARFVMGIGAANSTIMRSYAASATTLEERTSVMAILSASQGVGFILGPLIQAAFAFLSFPGPIDRPWLHMNIYTAPAFFGVLTAAVNVVLFITSFKDVRVVSSIKQSMNGSASHRNSVSSTENQEELLSIVCSLYTFFVIFLTFTNYETIASPLSIDMYAWSKEASTKNNGFILGALGCMSVVVVIAMKFLAKKFQDRVLLLVGMVISFAGYLIFLPWGSHYPRIQMPTFTPITVTVSQASTSLSTTSMSTGLPTTTSDSDDGGCPLNYAWCYTVPIVQLWQYILASVVITIGFSMCNVICFSIVSKKLGHKPQGTIMGIMNSVGASARAIGPISVGVLYENWGPRVMMVFMLVFVLSSIITLVVNYNRMYIEPEKPNDLDHDEENNIDVADPLNINNDIAE